jgi:hypothetical protein
MDTNDHHGGGNINDSRKHDLFLAIPVYKVSQILVTEMYTTFEA